MPKEELVNDSDDDNDDEGGVSFDERIAFADKVRKLNVE